MVGPEFGMMFEGSEGRLGVVRGWNVLQRVSIGRIISIKEPNLPSDISGADYLRTNFAGGGLTTIDVAQAGELIEWRFDYHCFSRSACRQVHL